MNVNIALVDRIYLIFQINSTANKPDGQIQIKFLKD